MNGKYEKANLRIMTHNVWNMEPCGRDARYRDFYRKYSPDIICMQEMSDRIRTDVMIKGLEEDYEFVPVNTDGLTNFTPILVKKNMFRILECGWHLFSGYNDAASKSITWAALENKSTGERFGIASNHFWWMEHELEHEAWRISNAHEMRAFCEYMRVKYDMPVFTAGDFNCDMRSMAYAEILKGGAVDALNCAQISANRSNTCNTCYPVKDENGIFRAAPKLCGSCIDSIDHILVYGIDRVDVYVHNIINSEDAREQSDHCPVYIDCSVKNRSEDNPRIIEK